MRNRVRTNSDTGDDTDTEDLAVNGGFDFPTFAPDEGRFLEWQEADGWSMTRSAGGGKRVMQLWSADLGQPLAAPFPHGPWLGLTGTISRTLPTEAGANYRLSYLSRAAGRATHSSPSSWAGGNICDVLLDGVVVQTIVTVAEPLHTRHDVYFTATASESTLAFAVVGHRAVGLDTVSLVKIRLEDSLASGENFAPWLAAFARDAS